MLFFFPQNICTRLLPLVSTQHQQKEHKCVVPVIRFLPWFFFQIAEGPEGDFGDDVGGLFCAWCWPWLSGSSIAAAKSTYEGRSGTTFLSSGCSDWMSWLEMTVGASGGAAAEFGWGTELYEHGVWEVIAWDLDIESSSRGFWFVAIGVRFGLRPVLTKGGAVSVTLGLTRGTLEQVCRWVRRPRYDRNFVRQLSQLKQECFVTKQQMIYGEYHLRMELTERICWVCDDASCVPLVFSCWGRNCCSQP